MGGTTTRKRKPTKKPTQKKLASKRKVARIKIDLSQWELWDWRDELEKLIDIRRTRYGVNISVDLAGSAFEEAARKIATEAIERFLNDSALPDFTPEGLEIRANEMSRPFKVGWHHLCLGGGIDALKALRQWLEEQWGDMLAGADDENRELLEKLADEIFAPLKRVENGDK